MFSSAAATIETDTLENGDMTVTCSAQDVLDMSWSVRLTFPYSSEDIYFSTILQSSSEDVDITNGITLSSAITSVSEFYYSTVESTMTISSSLNQMGAITFICEGQTIDWPFYGFERVSDSYNNCKCSHKH